MKKLSLRTDTIRKCKECSGLILAGERYCACIGREFERPSERAPEGSLNAAHNYHLWKSVQSGSWAKTGYRAPYSEARRQINALYANGSGRGWEIHRAPRTTVPRMSVEWFVYRCSLAVQYWRDPWAGLMGKRLELWLAGCTKEKVGDLLGLSQEKLGWLDKEIRKYVNFPGRVAGANTDYLKFGRRMKATGPTSALEIIRRHVHYKQSQLVPNHQLKTLSPRIEAIYEGETSMKKKPTKAEKQMGRLQKEVKAMTTYVQELDNQVMSLAEIKADIVRLDQEKAELLAELAQLKAGRADHLGALGGRVV